MADSHDINQVLGFGHADSPSKQATSERVCERIESILQKFGPGIDIERDIRKRPNSIHFRPGAWRWRFANGEFMECLIKFLVRRTNVQYDGYLDPGIHELGRIYQLNAAVDHGATGRARESHTQGVNEASKTIQRILQMVAIRQEIFTAVDSPDRSESRPGNLTTAIRIRTVEMALQDDHQAFMYDFIMEHLYSLTISTRDSASLHTSQGRTRKSTPTRVNIGSQKILSLASTHIDFALLTKANVRNIRFIAELDEKLSGSSVMNAALRHNHSGGLQWYFYHTCPSRKYPVPDSVGLMRYICFDSPKISCVVKMAVELRQEKKATVDLLPSCSDTSSYTVGVDYYTCCSHGIILELPETAAILFQTISRPNFPGEFFWDILICKGTFDSYQESCLMADQANILATGAQIPKEIKGQIRIICAYELLRVCLGQRVNLYPRNRFEWEFFDDEQDICEGEFYSALAQLVLKTPALGKYCTEKNLGRISASWKPGMELTPDHIRGRMPVLADGVALRDFGDDERGDEDTSSGEGSDFAAECGMDWWE
ncbi:uncharacterized protein TRIVIDRAFT_68922 [Trichoderma virens Gv29-8]|uniref:Uncharacterized protein n=1 Tax=Hypocrea virens (strain Gv29-8 / FGSC 10586) TaxID=413071 RepID=G9MYV5_HYPVG|nr:uncharacterized protein TRIVIDRAFT_68922 [Trichoderma virens Gv29-8]EHK20284.1 hypothetical protein TRIVIDRAFT_68922 [Trichoderma virens Gv29-8]